MVFGLFRKKRSDIKEIDEKVKTSFKIMRNDMEKISNWVLHFKERHEEHDKKHEHHDGRIEDIYLRLIKLEKKLEDVWTGVQTGVQTAVRTSALSKHRQTDVRSKRTTKGVQTGVQTENEELIETLRGLTPMERVVVWTLLNTDLKLSYDDLCTALGKRKSTLRGQINGIKQKTEDLIREKIETDGTKRFYISESLKEDLMGRINRKRKKEEGETEEVMVRIDGVG